MSRRYFRPGAIVGHILVLAASLTCLRLGWWQWEVFSASGGTGQNLGYSLLWPVFAGAFIYMWLRFLQLEGTRDDEVASEPGQAGDGVDSDPTEDDGADRPRERHKFSVAESHTVGVGFISEDDDDDPELAAYNRALAQLAEQDNDRAD